MSESRENIGYAETHGRHDRDERPDPPDNCGCIELAVALERERREDGGA